MQYVGIHVVKLPKRLRVTVRFDRRFVWCGSGPCIESIALIKFEAAARHFQSQAWSPGQIEKLQIRNVKGEL